MQVLRGLLGVAAILGIAFALSRHRRNIRAKVVIFGLLLQVVLAGVILKSPAGQAVFRGLAEFITRVLGYADGGSAFVFGSLADPGGPSGFVFFVKVFGTILFVSAAMAILYHIGVMQVVVWCLARMMILIMGVTGAESLSVAANVFVGQTEAPLVVRPYIRGMTRSELMALMCGGFATIAGSVMGVYMGMLGPAYGPHLLSASIMAAPAAFVVAKIMLPETAESETGARATLRFERTHTNLLDAVAEGVTDGLKLALNVAAMLVAFVAVIRLADWPLSTVVLGGEPLSLQRLFGWIFAPFAWVMGVSAADAAPFGSLLGFKISVNEFVAYTELQSMTAAGSLSPRSVTMATYALCGFANFASVGIQIGGIAPLAPERRGDLARLGLFAMTAGALATCLTSTIAGIFL